MHLINHKYLLYFLLPIILIYGNEKLRIRNETKYTVLVNKTEKGYMAKYLKFKLIYPGFVFLTIKSCNN